MKLLFTLALLLATPSWAAPPPKSWLIVVYLPYAEGYVPKVPYMKVYQVDREICNREAKDIFNKVKAGKVRAFCL